MPGYEQTLDLLTCFGLCHNILSCLIYQSLLTIHSITAWCFSYTNHHSSLSTLLHAHIHIHTLHITMQCVTNYQLANYCTFWVNNHRQLRISVGDLFYQHIKPLVYPLCNNTYSCSDIGISNNNLSNDSHLLIIHMTASSW